MAMTVTDIELADGDYCFTLRDAGGEDLVLFGFATEAEAKIARDALRQIAQHATVILPVAQSTPALEDAAVSAEDSGNADQSESVDPDEKGETTSPFSR